MRVRVRREMGEGAGSETGNGNYLAVVPAEDVCPFFAGVVLSIVKHQICELNKRTST